ncbi:MAG: hypothetical protein KAS75_07465 [Planctomycetes bacterium]|nr:hypothetical protein [Planctomycetota bacterium]
MKMNFGNSSRAGNRLISQLTAEKKKTVMAVCLIAVMIFMWVRLLGDKKPKNAKAAWMMGKANSGASVSGSEFGMSFVELPKVKGRNDVLARDFFVADAQGLDSDRGASVVLRNGFEGVGARIAEKLKLEAIGMGERPQAFINDKLLTVGDKLLVNDGLNTYECEVSEIEKNSVSIRCGEAEIELKLSQVIEGN